MVIPRAAKVQRSVPTAGFRFADRRAVTAKMEARECTVESTACTGTCGHRTRSNTHVEPFMEIGSKYGGKYSWKHKKLLYRPRSDAILHDLLIHSSMTLGHNRSKPAQRSASAMYCSLPLLLLINTLAYGRREAL